MVSASSTVINSSYLLPVDDAEFLRRDELRAIRFALEYSKSECVLRDWGIRSTIVVFGSARVPSPEQLAAMDPQSKAGRKAKMAGYYEMARRFAQIVSEEGGAKDPVDGIRDNVIATGGGPGIMEAANRGAFDAGAPSIGFNITLPHEQEPNAYSTPELTFSFHYFAMRKMHLAMRAAALAVFPGGFGTLDECAELLTLTQCAKMRPAPIVFFGTDYWRKVLNFDVMLDHGMIDEKDLDLFEFADDASEGWQIMLRRGLKPHHR